MNYTTQLTTSQGSPAGNPRRAALENSGRWKRDAGMISHFLLETGGLYLPSASKRRIGGCSLTCDLTSLLLVQPVGDCFKDLVTSKCLLSPPAAICVAVERQRVLNPILFMTSQLLHRNSLSSSAFHPMRNEDSDSNWTSHLSATSHLSVSFQSLMELWHIFFVQAFTITCRPLFVHPHGANR